MSGCLDVQASSALMETVVGSVHRADTGKSLLRAFGEQAHLLSSTDSPSRCEQARMLPAGAPSAFTMPDGHQVELIIIICTIATHIIIITSLANQYLSYFGQDYVMIFLPEVGLDMDNLTNFIRALL